MRDLSSFEPFKLDKVQMGAVKGGICAKAYCDNLYALYKDRDGNFNADETTGFAVGWTQAGCGQWHKDVTLPSKT